MSNTGLNGAPTFASVLRDYGRDKRQGELRGDWAVLLFYRIWSFPLIWLLARTPVSPTAVTLSSVPLALSMPVLALTLPLEQAALGVGLVAIVFQILDCVDGGLARCTGRTSRLGGTLDFLIDMAQWGLLYGSIGLLADRVLDTGALWTAVGCAAAWVRLYARVVRDAGAGGADAVHAADAAGEKRPAGPLDIVLWFFAGLSGAIPPALLLAWWSGTLSWLIVFLLVYALADVAEGLVETLARRDG
ncbi:CDP-alcohol phosphatidyltransferase family protein [Stappia stellulata]|uniref:CDP-alcohol phosphatidyltransferase family protein n=1 Tax=Stappia stellulata TaxID=71235 RepID=UPI001CD5FF87|nr:CDP-alcohol phosphatidyltransferase family protein [Stappia stellulata]MCA1243871.1 CDP-alcohol phosphatidyltransferase family protein [Stappia stellulata]